MGFRWHLSSDKRDPGDFKCSACAASDVVIRNCGNHRGLPDAALAVHAEEYTYTRYKEHDKAGAKLVYPLGEYRLYECPVSFITQETWEIIRLVYLVEDSKQLLFAGGLANQPFWLVEAIGIYKAEIVRLTPKPPEGANG